MSVLLRDYNGSIVRATMIHRIDRVVLRIEMLRRGGKGLSGNGIVRLGEFRVSAECERVDARREGFAFGGVTSTADARGNTCGDPVVPQDLRFHNCRIGGAGILYGLRPLTGPLAIPLQSSGD